MKFFLRKFQILYSFLYSVSLMTVLFFVSANAFADDKAERVIAGKVVNTTGSVQAVSPSEPQSRILARGNDFFTTDTLITGADSTAQIRFSDGSLMSLYSNSQLKIDNYSYKNNPKTDKNILSLIKGGFRTLTGLISKSNPDAYQIKTPVSVIGVRGTNYSAVLENDKLYAGVWKGAIYVKNDAGTLELGEGNSFKYAVVESKNKMPLGLLTPPAPLNRLCKDLNKNLNTARDTK